MQKFQLSRELCKYRGTIIDDAFLYVVRFFNSLSTNSLAVTDSISVSARVFREEVTAVPARTPVPRRKQGYRVGRN